jgi:hypothetical protein
MKDLTIRSAPQCGEHTYCREFNTHKDKGKMLHGDLYLEPIENIAVSESQRPPSHQRGTDTYPGASAATSDGIAELRVPDTHSCLQTNL